MRLEPPVRSRSITPSIPFLNLNDSKTQTQDSIPLLQQIFNLNTSIQQHSISAHNILFPESIQLELKPPASISTLPPEILFEILSLAHSASDSNRFILSGQFSSASPLCPLCSFRTLGSVCSTWLIIMKELFWSEIVLGGQVGIRNVIEEEEVNKVEGEEVGTFWKHLEDDGNGNLVRKLDASLRIWSSGGFRSAVGKDQSESRESSVEKDRLVLRRVLASTPLLSQFDADFEYYAILPSPFILPPTIRTLTMRNTNPITAIAIINQLPLLTNLTIRLALPWFLSNPSESEEIVPATCELTNFSLSVTGFGESDSYTIVDNILANSKKSLRSLTLRNKVSVNCVGFFSVGRDILRVFGEGLKEVRIFDIPTDGLRKENDTSTTFFDSTKPIPLPSLLSLHLCGITYSPDLYLSLQSSLLHELIIEDFDSETGDSINQSLLSESPSFESLKYLKIVTRILGWNEECRSELERICKMKGIELKGSWGMRRLEKDWW